MIQYITKYPNQVHLLKISVSRHFYLTKMGVLAYQKKPFDIDLESLPRSNKTHIINYLVKDHYSSVLYGEISTSSDILSPIEFLFRAWSQKTDSSFCGMPEGITIPKTVQVQFPNLIGKIESLGVEIIQVTSGFQGGVGDIKIWEDFLKFCTGKTFLEAKQFSMPSSIFISQKESRKGTSGETKIERWRTNIKELKFPPKNWLS